MSNREIKEILSFRDHTQQNANDFLIGFGSVIDDILTCLLADGHAMIIGSPGLGKTLLVKVLASIWGLSFSRIQFTPDLLPSDITGTEILQEKAGKSGKTERSLEFHEGPVFANIVLADEINRTPPKTQSAMLQSMEEREVTYGKRTLKLPSPFLVLATQNPIEMEGTYPLPEAQLDRFLLSIQLNYPDMSSEKKIAVLEKSSASDFKKIHSILKKENLFKWYELVESVTLPESILNKLVKSVRNTRPGSGHKYADEFGEYGAGPRATQNLVRAARARALLNGTNIVTEQIVRDLFAPVLRHRIILNYAALAEKITPESYLQECIDI